MPKLEFLNLAENVIHGVADRWLETLESLKYLNLSNNKMPHIGDWVIYNFNIQLLDVNLIKIINLSRHLEVCMFLWNLDIIFKELVLILGGEKTKLVELDLSYNAIGPLYQNSFA